MFSVKSLGTFDIRGRGPGFLINSPVSVERDGKSIFEAIGETILIDGKEYKIKGIEMYMPATPVRIGEEIGILVQHIESNDEE